MKRTVTLAVLLAVAALAACTSDADTQVFDSTSDDDAGVADAAEGDAAEGDDALDDQAAEAGADEDGDEARVGFEILQFVSSDEIVVWFGRELTLEAFEALELSQGWFKNQPREGEPDGGAFLRSPDAVADGEFVNEEHFGHVWLHNATIIEANSPLDDGGLLSLNRVAKFHKIQFNAGRRLFILVSPEGERFVRISRDLGRTREVPTLPDGWQIVEHVTEQEVIFDLPNPTVNIRCDNEDSFQGPVTGLEGF